MGNLFLQLIKKVEVSGVDDLENKNSFISRRNHILSASFSPDKKEPKVLILIEDGLYIWQDFSTGDPVRISSNRINFSAKDSGKTSPNKIKEKIISAFFTEDGRRILCEGESGTIYILDALTAKLIRANEKSIENSFISPSGNYFIISALKDFFVYNSYGKQIKFPSFNKYRIR
jgi:WD40 repeat protein